MEQFLEHDWQARKLAYIRLYEQLILPEIFEKYWEEVWHKRKNDPFRPDAIFKDIFQRMTEFADGNPKAKRGVIRLCSTINEPYFFWELHLAIYRILYTEETNDAFWAQTILRSVELAEVDPKEYRNVQPGHWLFLSKIANSQRPNKFFENPVLGVYLCRAATWLQSMPQLADRAFEYLQDPSKLELVDEKARETINQIFARTHKDVMEILSLKKEETREIDEE